MPYDKKLNKFILHSHNGRDIRGGDVGSVVPVNSAQFDTTPTITGSEPIGTQYWSDSEKTMSFSVEGGTIDVNKEIFDYYVDTNNNLVEGNVVSVTGISGNRQAVTKTNNTSRASSTACIGMVTHKNADGTVRVTKAGRVRKLNTNGMTEGMPIYANSTGGYTQTAPTAPAYFIHLGIVEVSQTNNGVIDIDVRVSPNLEDISNVDGSAPDATGDLLSWNNTLGVWERNTHNITNYGLLAGNQTWTGTNKFGNATDYVQIDNNGEVTLNGDATVWDDSMTPANSFRTGGTSLTLAQFIGNIWMLRFDVGDILYVQVQLPHTYKINSVIYPHLHLAVKSAIGATGYNVEVTTETAWASLNNVFSTPTVTSTGLVHSFQNKAQYSHEVMSLTAMTPTASEGGISSFVIFKIERISSSVQPLNPATSLFILGLDIHYEIDTLGSNEEFIK